MDESASYGGLAWHGASARQVTASARESVRTSRQGAREGGAPWANLTDRERGYLYEGHDVDGDRNIFAEREVRQSHQRSRLTGQALNSDRARTYVAEHVGMAHTAYAGRACGAMSDDDLRDAVADMGVDVGDMSRDDMLAMLGYAPTPNVSPATSRARKAAKATDMVRVDKARAAANRQRQVETFARQLARMPRAQWQSWARQNVPMVIRQTVLTAAQIAVTHGIA